MAQQLTNLEITRVSLVDKGANQRRLAVLKRDEEAHMTELAAAPADATPGGIAAWLRKAADAVLGKAASVAKTQTFAAMVAGQELQEALGESWWTLQDALWAAIYATDDSGADLSLEAKQALVGQNLDEFKAYLLAEMSEATGVSKRAGSPGEAAAHGISGLVAKVGRKISGSRLERLQAAAEALSSVLTEVDETKDDTEQEDDVEKAELVAAFTEANAPIVKRLEALEAKVTKSDGAGPADGGEGEGEELTLEGIAEAVGKLADLVAPVVKAASSGSRTSIAGQDGGSEPVKKSVFSGMF